MSLQHKRPKNARAKRAMDARLPQMKEGAKKAFVMKGANSSQLINDVLSDICLLKKPDSKKLSKRNKTRPFEDQGSVEFLSRANDCSLFAFGSHSKKRPHNLILGRCFDYQVLDMLEFGVDPASMKTIETMHRFRKSTAQSGLKPSFVFVGDEFEHNTDLARAKNLLLDFFRGEPLEKFNLAGLSRVILCTSNGNQVLLRHYAIALKKSGARVPKLKLSELGPRLDLTFRRRIEADEAVRSEAMKQPKLDRTASSRKNVEDGKLGQTMGRVHMQRQDLSQLALHKSKALPKKRRRTTSADDAEQQE